MTPAGGDPTATKTQHRRPYSPNRVCRPHAPGQGLVQVSDGVDGVPLAMKPNVVEPPAGSDPLYETLLTVAVEPLTVRVPFHTCVMV